MREFRKEEETEHRDLITTGHGDLFCVSHKTEASQQLEEKIDYLNLLCGFLDQGYILQTSQESKKKN